VAQLVHADVHGAVRDDRRRVRLVHVLVQVQVAVASRFPHQRVHALLEGSLAGPSARDSRGRDVRHGTDNGTASAYNDGRTT
jgi:hypothetical protein